MGYPKPSKQQRNKEFLSSQGFQVGNNPYLEEGIRQKKFFLIICEGENTEPSYFKSFPVPTKTIIVEGGRNSKTKLVEYALMLQQNEENKDREIWCVFDFDRKPDEHATQPADFNNSIVVAEANGMKVAWSNDAFELWFLLHYQNLDTALTREEINDVLKKKWGLQSFHNEAKTKTFCERNYERHGGTKSDQQVLAIKRAKTLHDAYQGRKDYANQCPCTTVYLLVEELNKNLKE